MKSVLGIAVLLTWFARCNEHGVEVPDPHDPHGPAAGHSGSEDDAGVEEAVSNCTPTDLYKPRACENRNNPCYGLRKYTPKYELWADGAEKERFIYLPPGATIDTANPDRWNFPKNTKIFKTFSVDGLRIETRVMTKLSDQAGSANWSFVAFKWNAEQTEATQLDAMEAANGVQNHLSNHDIPKTDDCKNCHTVPGTDAVNGFGALDLNYDGAGFTLRELLDKRLLTNAQGPTMITVDNARLPGRGVTRDALGYLHANCGHCHGSASPKARLQLWASTGTPDLCMQPAYKDAVAQLLCTWTGHAIPNGNGENYVERIVPGDAAHSGMIARMKARPMPNDGGRGKADQMPKIATEVPDQRGIEIVSRWIESREIERCLNDGDYVQNVCPPKPVAGTGGSSGGAGASGMGAAGAGGATAGAGGG